MYLQLLKPKNKSKTEKAAEEEINEEHPISMHDYSPEELAALMKYKTNHLIVSKEKHKA
jgi:hypothetical protein